MLHIFALNFVNFTPSANFDKSFDLKLIILTKFTSQAANICLNSTFLGPKGAQEMKMLYVCPSLCIML